MLPSNTASAAVTPNVAPNKVTYTGTYAAIKSYTNPPTATKSYSDLTPGLTDQYVEGSTANGVVTLKRMGTQAQVVSYASVIASIQVPAFTEYTINFSYSGSAYRQAPSTVRHHRLQIFYYGNTADDPTAQDQSSNMTFAGENGGTTSCSDGHNYMINSVNVSTNTTSPISGTIPSIAIDNTTNTAKTYYMYFGVMGSMGYDASSGNYHFTDSVTFTSTLKVTAITPPSVDNTSADYDASGNTFTFSDYDRDRLECTVTYKHPSGRVEPTTASIGSNDKCTLTTIGTYTFTFSIKSTCGAVWNSSNDQSPKPIIITINGSSVTPPGTTAIEIEYDGTPQSLSTLSSPPDWYSTNKTLFDDKTVIAMDDEFTDAGDNEVTVTLIDGRYYWSDYATTPTNSRTFNFNITKKPLAVTFEEDADTGLLVAKYDDSQLISDSDKAGKKPVLVTKYSKTGQFTDALDAPDGLGNWYAIAVLSNADSCNYAVPANTRQQFSATKKRVAYPTLNSLSSSSQSYNNSLRTFLFKGYDSELMNFTVPVGAESFDGTTLTAKKAGTYNIVFTLKDESLYEWSGNTALTVEITKYVLAIVPDDNPTEWISGTATELKFLATPLSGDSVNLAAKISMDGGDGEDIAVVNNGDGTHTVTIPAIYLAGEYTLTVKVADGENYVSDEEVFEFTIQGESFDLDESNIRWLVNNKTHTFVLDEDGYLQLPYTGSDITFTVDIRAYAYLKVESYGGTQTAKDLGEYEVTAHIIATDNAPSAFDKTFTLKYKIIPKVLNFDNAVWEWQYEGDTEWETMSDRNMPPYDGKAVNVRISPDYFTDLGLAEIDYSVSYQHANDLTEKGDKSTKAIITIANENFTTADGESCEVTKAWEITARALKYQWNATQTIKAGDTQFEFAAITFEEDGDFSQYFEYYYTVDGEDGEFTREQLEAYLEANWSETNTVTGKVCVRMTGVSEDFVIRESFRSFSTGASKTALAVTVTTNETTAYGDVGFNFTVLRGGADERARVAVTINGQTFDGNNVKAISDYLNTLDVGTYTVTVSVKDENSYMVTGDISYPLTITPADLKVKWNSKGTLDLDSGSGYKGSLDGLFTYTYKDADGNVVEKPEKGKTYTVEAALKDSVKKNFTLSDEMSLLISTPYEFTMSDGGSSLKNLLPIIMGVALGLLLLLALILFLVLRRRRADDYDDEYDDEYDYDDEDEEDEEDEDEEYDDYDE